MSDTIETLIAATINEREALLLTMTDDQYTAVRAELHGATGDSAAFYRGDLPPALAMQVVLDPLDGATEEQDTTARAVVIDATGIDDAERAARLCQVRAHADAVAESRPVYQRHPWPLSQ